MTYDLIIGDRSFSSWSLRGWLMFEKFNIPCRTTLAGLYSGSLAQDLLPLAPARQVPAIRTPEGDVLGETMAIAETLAERHPDAGLWPADASARILARWLVSEMHAGFGGIRNECPMQLLHQYKGFSVPKSVLDDLDRLQVLWALARKKYGQSGPWLFGDYSLADVFFAPVAARIAGYDLPVGKDAETYVQHHLKDQAFRQWRALGATVSYDPIPYVLDLNTRIWPGPTVIAARAIAHGPSENSICPYSGKPVNYYLEINGKVYGFCNLTCRDKTVADPGAWPKFTMLLNDQQAL